MYTGTSNGTIQEMINRTSNGDSVFVLPGTYHENLVIDRAIVFGALDSASPPEIVTSDSRAGITLAADGITLNGLNLSGSAPTGLVVQSNNNRISDITVQGLKRGIELKNAANNIFSENTLSKNSIGILIDRSSRSNTFLLNQFDNLIADVSGQPAENQWYSNGQDYTYKGSNHYGSLGNFWKAYTGTDADGNGVGDTTFTITDTLTAPTTGSGVPEAVDRAPLIALPDSYTLLVKNTSSLNATGGNAPSNHQDFATERQKLQQQLQQSPQGQNPPALETPGGVGQFPNDLPSSVPKNTATPPGGIAMLPRILLDFWWVIALVVIISVIIGVGVERSRKKKHAPAPATTTPAPNEYLQVTPAANATVVKRPGGGSGPAEDWRDQSHYAAHLPPALVKKYPDAEYMGEGGVGRVFRAWDATENRAVAVKIPIRFDEITGTQFTKELHIWQGLHHNNIVEIYAANVFPMPYIEMEYIENSLANLKFPVDTDRAVRIVTGIAEGLRYAHDQGIVHRDIKPENILITPNDIPKITDWGLAKALSDTKQTGLISFSLNYAAPEQLAPNLYGDAGPWTDIYQLGVLFYEMVTGRLPFSGGGMGEITQAILHDTPLPPQPSGRNADAIKAIISRCLQKQPKDRYVSVAEILDDLHALNSGE
jgi:parallel beta-helix repeat protein